MAGHIMIHGALILFSDKGRLDFGAEETVIQHSQMGSAMDLTPDEIAEIARKWAQDEAPNYPEPPPRPPFPSLPLTGSLFTEVPRG